MMPTTSREFELRLLRFVRQVAAHLEQVEDADKILKHCLRAACELFDAGDGCIATMPPGRDRAELTFVIPRDGAWDLPGLSAFLRGEKSDVPGDTLLAPLRRRGRTWAVLALRRRAGQFEREAIRDLREVTTTIAELLERVDRQRVIEVRARIDKKIMEELRPRDLFYQILHGLRSLTGYDHSSALLMCDGDGQMLELAAEQVAWLKGKSRRIGLKLPITDEQRAAMLRGGVFGFDRADGGWRQWHGAAAGVLAAALDYHRADDSGASAAREGAMICTPLATRGGVIGAVKIAALHPGAFGSYECELLEQFSCQASVAIQYLQRTESLHTRMLAAEKKHIIADLARGVSHDVNNALGAVVPLVQQMLADVQSERADPAVLADDLTQIEQSLQVCRRIFGGMLSVARSSARKIGQGNVRRALDSTLAILKDGMERQGIRLEVEVADDLPSVRGGQGDLEQLFLNLSTNARDAMPSGGALSVRAQPRGTMVEVFIQDNGCGIPPEHHARIHEPFFTTKPHGNGLGLSICRSIIWEMQGDLDIQSQPGVGTEVRILLPTGEAGPQGERP